MVSCSSNRGQSECIGSHVSCDFSCLAFLLIMRAASEVQGAAVSVAPSAMTDSDSEVLALEAELESLLELFMDCL